MGPNSVQGYTLLNSPSNWMLIAVQTYVLTQEVGCLDGPDVEGLESETHTFVGLALKEYLEGNSFKSNVHVYFLLNHSLVCSSASKQDCSKCS